jgi:hypothetical protein
MEVVIARSGKSFPRLIQWFTKSNWSHSALKYDDMWMVHASVGGVQPAWWCYFKKHYIDIIRFKCKFPEAKLATDKLIRRIGWQDYDYASLFGNAIYLTLRWMGFNIKKNPLGNPESYMCTEVVAEFFKECNKLNPNLNLNEFYSETLQPVQLVNYMKYRDDLFEVVD